MRPNRSGGLQYFYYGCPRHYDGRCSNRRKVRGDWLWKIFVTMVREKLFPLPGPGDDNVPGWVRELMTEVRVELNALLVQKQNHRPVLERERADLENQIAGWSQSLANPSLAQTVRRHIEEEFNRASARQQQLQTELAGLDHENKRADDLLRGDAAIERLHHLHELLADSNPTAVNLELARHVEAIYVHPDGRVVIRAHRLGIFEGLTETLVLPTGRAADSGAEGPAESKQAARPRKALLKRNGADVHLTGAASRAAVPLSLMSVNLPDKWVREEVVTMPKRHSWAHLHAKEVLQKRAKTQWSQNKLAKFFGVTPPTIRHAIKLAKEADDED